MYEDIELIKRKGLAKGGSLENGVVVKDQEILNTEGLRNSKEFVNHKILDCIGIYIPLVIELCIGEMFKVVIILQTSF